MAIKIEGKRLITITDSEAATITGRLSIKDDNTFTFEIVTPTGHIRGHSLKRIEELQDALVLIGEIITGTEGLICSPESDPAFIPMQDDPKLERLIEEVVNVSYAKIMEELSPDELDPLSQLDTKSPASDSPQTTDPTPSAAQAQKELEQSHAVPQKAPIRIPPLKVDPDFKPK